MSNTAKLKNALKLHADGRIAEAESIYREILADDPEDMHAHLNLASLAFDRGEFDEARKHCEVACAVGEAASPAEVILSRIAFIEGNAKEGLRHIRRAHNMAPGEMAIAHEFVSAVRRHYWTYNPEEYQDLFEQAMEGYLEIGSLARLVHQAFSKIVRPGLIDLIVAPSGESTLPVIETWRKTLDGTAAKDLAVLTRNFSAALANLRSADLYGGKRANLTLRDGSVRHERWLTDVDSLTHGMLELVGDEGLLVYIPFQELEYVEFGKPASVVKATVGFANGEEVGGYVPLFYLFTEFSEDDDIRGGKRTLLRKLTDDAIVPVGMREWNTEDALLPLANVARVEFLPGK